MCWLPSTQNVDTELGGGWNFETRSLSTSWRVHHNLYEVIEQGRIYFMYMFGEEEAVVLQQRPQQSDN